MTVRAALPVLTSALALLAAVPALAGDAAPVRREAQVSTVQAHEMVFVKDGAADGAENHTILVKARAVDGGAPQTQVQVLGGEGSFETFELGDLAVGDSKSFTTSDGRALEIKRTETGLSLSLDGKAIDLPQLAHLPGVAAAPAGLWISKEGDETVLPGGQAFAFTTDVTAADGVEQDVIVRAVPGPGCLAAMGMPHVNFDELETLKGLDADVREKVVAALHEILSQRAPHVIRVVATAPGDEVDVEDAADGSTPHVVIRKVRTAAPAPKVE